MPEQKPVIVQIASGARYGLSSAEKAKEIYPNAVIVGYQDGSPYTETPGDAGGPLTAHFDREEMKKLKLDQLKSLAVDAGADTEDVTKLRSKDEVLDEIEKHVDWSETVHGNADDGDGE